MCFEALAEFYSPGIHDLVIGKQGPNCSRDANSCAASVCLRAIFSIFCVEKGNTQFVQNITISYLEQINSYYDMIFFPLILHGKHLKTN